MKSIVNRTLLCILFLGSLGKEIPVMGNMLSQQIEKEHKKKKKKVKTKDRDGNTISTMSCEKLQEAIDRFVASGDFDSASKYLEELVRILTDHNEKPKRMLQLADIWFKGKEYKMAQRVYEQFEAEYPGSEMVSFALARAIECAFHQLNGKDRDQTPTEDALELCARFMERKEVGSEYIAQVQSIEKKCWQLLFDHELYVADFYYNRGNFKAAQQRIASLNKRFITAPITVELEVLPRSIAVAQGLGDTLAATKLQITLAEKYPTSSAAQPLLATMPELKLQLATLEQQQTATAQA